MNVLALDFGLKRIGTAVGSTESGIAFARAVLKNTDFLYEDVGKIILHDQIEQILLGMPYRQRGEVGTIHDELMDFYDELMDRFDLPIEMIDERYTSKMAIQKLHDMGMKAREQRGHVDSLAAQHFLQEWLDEQDGGQ
ncbi:MAG: Holliday junction resolvase RuvX [bacterium]|nr:Holliday junction resolvase RuvX [bacterium]